MDNFISINPYNGQVVHTFKAISEKELEEKLNLSQTVFQSWKATSLADRTDLLKRVGSLLRDNTLEYAKMITLEMGKPIQESIGEINKCALVCDYYADNAKAFLADEVIPTEAKLSFVKQDPIGTIFAVMPWNFPFWQVFRFLAPTLTAGNNAVLKHASNVFGCAALIESIFLKAGYPIGVFQNLIVHHNQTEKIIAHKTIKAVSLTGSEAAGSAVAAIAGKHIKKSLLELGGSNAFIVWEDADIDQIIQTAVNARMLNNGQSCIAAKRFILLEGIYDEFVDKFKAAVSTLKSGDTMDKNTAIGPLARIDLANQLQEQVQTSINAGAVLILGGQQKDCFHEPTILGNVKPGMPAFDEETFGPLAAMIKAKDIEHAFALSEMSTFGLGITVCTQDIEKALSYAGRVSDGAYFINELVKSDPRLPFGGTKKSGYGRELAKDGILEFVNRKTVYVK
ncbi:NAD-dependent succinate-semialdehyde dehydrogenase [Putridiphycobacter roseus]|uniref:NAD-dependent succinate-semialdehyde dehydrogenase n=1 Tax=Putridiphycobacter roseus TaxID=2219161 RepID=A0A2W1MW07_9FLAO|nr:NAD-dependent succinate-semialdehyde dehydrogenase [Putridiphycobacter roseus]PZE16017.1 NAD-dependent succinate-semialdehyde dehydrogenase [Putridiphycobacter roseus]